MKKRLDLILVELGYFETREKAKREILVGNVFVNDKLDTKAGSQYDIEKIKDIRIKDKLKYVSRGGLKLEGAIKYFDLSFNDKIVMDIGASTGGFTDCAIQNGAKFVFAIDVGTNQLDYSLRNNEKVLSIEKTHIKEIKEEQIKEKVDIIVADVSFISITKIIDEIIRLENVLNENYEMILLIKPQFELTKEEIGKNGIVEKEENRQKAIKKVIDKLKAEKYQILGLEKSPITGSKGNIEYLVYVKK